MRQAISAAEWQVMRVIWAQPGVTSQVVIQALQEGFDWQSTTIKTLLGRLRKKEYLQMEKNGSKYHYWPLLSEEEHLESQIEGLLANVCSTKQGALVARLLDAGSFSQADFAELASKISSLKEQAPETISCHCLPGQCSCNQHCH